MKKYKIIIPFLALSLLLGGCGSGSPTGTASTTYNSSAESYAMNQAYDSVRMKDASSLVDGDTMAENGSGNLEQPVNDKSGQQRKLIKNVSIEMESTDFEKTISEINSDIENVNGYIEYSNIAGRSYESNEARYSKMKVRVPQENLDTFLDAAAAVGNIRNRTENISDITLQYADTKDHIEALETEQARLLELMEQADSVESIIALESRLSEVRYQIGSYASQMKIYDNQVEYSTIDIQVNEVTIYSAKDRAGAGERIISGFKINCEFIKLFTVDLFVFLVSNSPVIILMATIIFITIRIIIATERSKSSKSKLNTKTDSADKPKENK